ncbi:hypothetical protein OKA05_21195 [Luteolibacter arcticus]|uniref:Uncharacterized protein n=1 Tax=Luteolibacter arcticus TaxID=1581411 RepID=A0ABT3GNN6_9BACT|nr:hypothetical protein [Luteolibacter arcticus]MCW1925091.1 hypothetical protein [Luteolibacter arcticus]
MEVEVTRGIDCSEQDEYYYECDLFRFTSSGVTLNARSYTDSAEEVHFLSIEEGRRKRSIAEADFNLPLWSDAVQHLRESGKKSINWLSDCGYKPI